MGEPEIRYAWNGDVALAYQIIGSGSIDLVWIDGFVSPLDMLWENPALARSSGSSRAERA